MIINHNITALNTHRQLSSATNAQASSMEKLSSGLRINSAKDDAAGLSISEKMRGQIRGLEQASNNAQDGISLMQTAEGALNETHDILQRMRELAVQSANDTNTDTDRGEIQKEMDSLTSEINRIGNTTEFNTQKLLDGSKDTATKAADAIEAVDATAGIYSLATAGGADITIDDVDFTFEATDTDAAAGEFADLDGLVALINGNADLSAKYTASKDGTDLVLTQKAGQESATAPAGAAFTEDTAGAAAIKEAAAVEAGVGLQFQIGANENQSLTLEIADMRASALKLTGAAGAAGFTATNTVTDGTNNTKAEAALDVSTAANSAKAITIINTAIETVSAERSKLGANQNRLEHTINNLGTTSENLTSAESRIRDVDYAEAA